MMQTGATGVQQQQHRHHQLDAVLDRFRQMSLGNDPTAAQPLTSSPPAAWTAPSSGVGYYNYDNYGGAAAAAVEGVEGQHRQHHQGHSVLSLLSASPIPPMMSPLSGDLHQTGPASPPTPTPPYATPSRMMHAVRPMQMHGDETVDIDAVVSGGATSKKDPFHHKESPAGSETRKRTLPSPRKQLPTSSLTSDEDFVNTEMILTTLASSCDVYLQRAPLSTVTQLGTEVATPDDAKDFLSYLTATVTSAVAHAAIAAKAESGVGMVSSAAIRPPSGATVLTRLLFGHSSPRLDVFEILSQLITLAPRKAVAPPRSIAKGFRAMLLPEQQQQPYAAHHVAHFGALRIAAVEALTHIISLCFDVEEQPLQQPAPSFLPSNKGVATMKSLLVEGLERTSLLQHLVQVLLQAGSPEALRKAAVESTFVFLARIESLPSMSSSARLSAIYEPLLKVLAVDSCVDVRCFAAGCLRCLTTMAPSAGVVLQSAPALVRCLSQETSQDTRTLCCGALERMVRSALREADIAAIHPVSIAEAACRLLCQTTASAPEIVGGASLVGGVSSGERSDDGATESAICLSEGLVDALTALCELLEATVEFALMAAGVAASDGLATLKCFTDHRGVVCSTLLHLCRCRHPTGTDAASARSISEEPFYLPVAEKAASILLLLCLRAPPASGVPSLVAEMDNAVSVSRCIMTLAQRSPQGRGASQTETGPLSLLAKLTLIVGCSLLFSPMSRAGWRRALASLPPAWERELLDILQSTLETSVPLAYFDDVLLMDECGVLLNDPRGVQWESNSSDDPAAAQHPSEHSIRCLLDAQEVRRCAKTAAALSASVANWRAVERLRRQSDPQRGFLCFVLMGYAVTTMAEPLPSHTASPVFAPPPATAADHRTTLTGSQRGGGLTSPAFKGESLHDSITLAPSGTKRSLFPREEREDPAAARQHQQQQGRVHLDASNLMREPFLSVAGSSVTRNGGLVSMHALRQIQANHLASSSSAAPNLQHPARNPDVFFDLKKQFEAALRLVIQLSSHYHRKVLPVDVGTQQRRAAPIPQPKGPLINHRTRLSRTPLTGGQQTVLDGVERSMNLRTWTAKVVEEGDLFHFSIPLESLSIVSVDAVISKARKHLAAMKRLFLVTPQAQRERRWFLFDMHSVVMPALIAHLQLIKKMLGVHTDAHVRLALQVLPSLHTTANDQQHHPGEATTTTVVKRKCVTCTNVLDVCEFMAQTFSVRMATSANELMMMSTLGAAGSFASATEIKQAATAAAGSGSSAIDQGATSASDDDREHHMMKFFSPLFPSQPQPTSTSSRAGAAVLQPIPSSDINRRKRAMMFHVDSFSDDEHDDDDLSRDGGEEEVYGREEGATAADVWRQTKSTSSINHHQPQQQTHTNMASSSSNRHMEDDDDDDEFELRTLLSSGISI